MIPLFFSGLLSYLVGMKRRTRGVSRARKTILTLFVMYLSPLTSQVYLLANLFTKYITFILKWIAFIFGRDEDEDQ